MLLAHMNIGSKGHIVGSLPNVEGDDTVGNTTVSTSEHMSVVSITFQH